MSKKIILTEKQYNAVVKQMVSEAIDGIKNIDDNLLEEGLWDNVKYTLSKLGRYKADGKILGKGKVDKEAADKIQQIIDKKGNEVIKNLDSVISEQNPEFPNNKDPQQFLSTIMSIAAVYDSVVAATTKNPNEEGYLPVDAANGIINDLREYVKKFLDVDLAAVYSGLNEYELTDEQMCDIDEQLGLSNNLPSVSNRGIQRSRRRPNQDYEDDVEDAEYEIIDDEPENNQGNQTNKNKLTAAGVRSGLKAKRGKGGSDFASTRMATLKSNRLPLTLAGVGSALGGLSWLVNTDWFRSLFEEITSNPTTEYVREVVEDKSEIFANIQPGEGMTQIMNRLGDLNLTANSSPQDFLNGVKQLGGGDLQAGIDALSANGGIFQNPTAAKQVLEAIADDPNGYGSNLGQVFQGNWAGTGKQVGDLLVTKTGGSLKGIVVNTIVQMVPKVIMKTGVKVGAGYAVAKGLGAALGPIGIGLIAAGALVKLFRMKGQKSSRAATLNALYQSIRNIEGGANIIEPEGEVIDIATAQNAEQINDKNKESGDKKVSGADKKLGGADSGVSGGNKQDELYNSLKNMFQFIVNNRKTLGTNAMGTPSSSNVGDRKYDSGQFMKGGRRAKSGGETQSGRERFFSNQSNVRENIDEVISEGKYIKDKRLIQYLSKSMPFDKIKNFENLINRVEYIRNVIKKMGLNSGDKVIDGFLKQLDSNPIMLTDFNKLFTVNVENPQEVNALLGMIKEILSTVYSGRYEDNNMVDKMATLGGNVNKLEEESGYFASEPNKSFLKDAQSKTTFKKNLSKFLGVAMYLFQHLHKQKSSKTNKKQQEPSKGPVVQDVFESKSIDDNILLKEEIFKIKNLMKKL
jgi:hypothetical protein